MIALTVYKGRLLVASLLLKSYKMYSVVQCLGVIVACCIIQFCTLYNVLCDSISHLKGAVTYKTLNRTHVYCDGWRLRV